MSTPHDRWPDTGASRRRFPIDPALEALRQCGAPVGDSGFVDALGVALIHNSYLYENTRQLPGVTRGLLDALARLGGTFLQRHAAVEGLAWVPGDKPGPLSTEIGHIASTLPAWAARQPWIAESTAVGHGLVGEPLPNRVVADLFRRVVGLLCVLDLYDSATRLAGGLLSDARRTAVVHDPVTTLQATARAAPVTYAYEREGPDHQSTYHAVATDTRGRRTTGTGRSKKAAAHEAARKFVQRYYPAAAATVTAVRPAAQAREMLGYRDHTWTVDRIQRAFALPPTARPLLSQALIHSSWTYEHQSETARAGQRSNQLLGLVGSHVLEHENRLAVARRAVVERPDTLLVVTLPNDAYERACRWADLTSGLLLGAGQSVLGTSPEIKANVFQAVMAAVYLSKRRPATLQSEWPPAWRPAWKMIAPGRARALDDTTRLQRAASGLRLDIAFEFKSSGPSHQAVFVATAILTSPLLGDSVAVTGGGASGKTAAKHEVSRRVLDILASSASGIPDDGGHALNRLVLAQQAAILASNNPPVAAWAASKQFGLDLIQSPEKLLEWAGQTDRHLRKRSSPQLVAGLTNAFRRARYLADTREQVIDAELLQTLDAIRAVTEPAGLDRTLTDRIVRLCRLFRCMGADEPDTDLGHLVGEWTSFHRDRLALTGPMPAVTLTARERAVLDAAANIMLRSKALATARVFGERPLRMRFTGPTKPDLAHACALWSAVTWSGVMRPVPGGLEVEIAGLTLPLNPGPVSQAAFAAPHPSPDPFRRRVADVLHDIKNHASASRQASNAVAATPAGHHEQQADAHRHLERMQRLALSLTAVTSVPDAAAGGDVDFGPFLRQYARDLLTRLPDRVGLDTPATDTAAQAAIDERSLGLILDNLTANAVEAMASGGRIRMDWTVDEETAIIEVADDGPGIGADVVAALESGARIRTTKQGGSGIGLLSVESLLQRVGGQLAWIPSPVGTKWHVRLPLTAPTEGTDE
ncbi:ATP-binding protein [Micromonospora sp. NPDC047762]|uniref:ATP-binding protein n=1 Tax=Micromonospora sp. NPDC047762 TaxID=3364255 RepID=UPI0037191084